MENGNGFPLSGTPINTLADTETAKYQPGVYVSGYGSDLTDEKALRNKAKRKTISQKMMLSMLDVVDKKGYEERKKAYWNTYYCQEKVYTSEGRLYGKYCKNRFCPLCCSIRKADIINRYWPIINSWRDPYFVTLTAKSVRAKSLKKRMKDMIRGFKILNDRYRKRNQRGKGINLIGIRTLESNFNPLTKTYNPHLHLIVATKEMAEIIIKGWLILCTPNFAKRKAQHMRRARDKKAALIEVVKYATKVFTEGEDPSEPHKKPSTEIYSAAMDNIFAAMKGCRIFERFGFNLPKEETRNSKKSVLLKESIMWSFDSKSYDWINTEKDCLTGYSPRAGLLDLLRNHFDIEIE
jgi:hypothetical protein